jgi:hypothetical protein
MLLMGFFAADCLSGQAGSSISDYRWARKNFRPAEFKGIRMGSSNWNDLRRLFGTPSYSIHGEDGQLYEGYPGIVPVPGNAEFAINPKTKVVEWMTIQPRGWKLSDAVKVFGKGFVRLRVTLRACGPEDSSAFSFFDANGDTGIVVFPTLGIVLDMARPEGEEIIGITYANGWIEPEKNPCEAGDRNKKPQGQKRKK